MFLRAQRYVPLKENSECGQSSSYSIYATPEDVILLDLFTKKCGDLEYLRITGYQPGDHWDRLFEIIKRYGKLKGLELFYNDGLKKVPKEIKGNPNLRVISIVGNKKLDYNNLFKKLEGLDSLQKISLVDNKLKEIPKSLQKVTSLKELHISGNENLNYEQLIDQLEKTDLEALSIPLNSLSDIPQNITKLKSLKVLDIRKNFIADFPNDLGEMDSLQSLQVEDNLILDLGEELSKIKDLNIKYVSFDVDNAEELNDLKKLFPKATVLNGNVPDESVASTQYQNEQTEDNFQPNQLKEELICTDAIDKYNSIFLSRNNYYSYDSLEFSERLVHSDYAYNEKILADGNYEGVPILMHGKWQPFKRSINYPKYKVKKGEIAFSICPNGNLYPELKAFNGMLWVYVGGQSKKEFFKTYVKGKNWKDVFLEFDEVNETFFVVLKGESLVRIPAYPRYVNKNASLKLAKLHYAKKYEMYERRLDLRGVRFDKELAREQEKSTLRKNKFETANWNKLSNYMCPFEQQLTKQGWLNYRKHVLDLQHKKLDTLITDFNNLKQSCLTRRVDFEEMEEGSTSRNVINSVTGSLNLTFSSRKGPENPEVIFVYYPSLNKMEYVTASGLMSFSNNLHFVVGIQTQNGWQVYSKKAFLSNVRSVYREKGEIEFYLDKDFASPDLKTFWKLVKNNQ